MNTLTQDAEEFQRNVLAIARQSFEDKDQQIRELQNRLELLEGLVTRLSAPRPQTQAQPERAQRPAPRRWSVR